MSALSELTGIPLGTLSKILAGMSDSPKLVNMISICQVLGCSLDYLVTGVPENHNNYLLSDEEIRMIENYRKLDAHGKEMTSLIIYKESERAVREQYVPAAPAVPTSDKVLSVPPVRAPFYTEVSRPGKRTVLLYDLPVSAGTGEYLDEEEGTEITIPDTERTRLADYALRISGNPVWNRSSVTATSCLSKIATAFRSANWGSLFWTEAGISRSSAGTG